MTLAIMRKMEWDMPCGKCDCGIYDEAALAAFNGELPKCKQFDRLCVGAAHAAVSEANRRKSTSVDLEQFRCLADFVLDRSTNAGNLNAAYALLALIDAHKGE